MTASTASSTTASSSAMPHSAPTTARSSSPISRTAWCAARPNCIRRMQSGCRMPEIAFSVESIGAAPGRRQHPVPQADRGGALRRATRACASPPARRIEAMRALASKFGAHLTFRHGESTGSIDLTPQASPKPQLAELATPPIDAARAIAQFQPRLLEAAVRDVRLGPDRPDRNAKAAIRRIADRADCRSAKSVRCRCACRCRISGRRGARPRPSAARPVRPRSRASLSAPLVRPAFFTSACTASSGIPISEAAISACAS